MSLRDMSPEARQALKEHHPSVLKYGFVDEFLREELAKDAFEQSMVDTFDLNPHLSIEWVTQKVAERVIAEGEPCTKEDVQLYWLTQLVTS